ncbi:hypothetical protein [Streptomyces sp. NPDC051997]|uniref:hypothetical protein n=1 Tax=Streptomyces sp. NPDC051997 TaxID=3155611 RepID=UPI0034151AD3
MINHPDIPLGHIIPAHQTFGWCAHCPDRTPAEELAAWQTRELRRMVDEARQSESPVHAVPLPGSNGISSCCGRPPCEFVGERVTRDPDAVTCTGPVVSQPDGEA